MKSSHYVIAALLSLINVTALKIDSTEQLNELNRYVDSKGNFINLAETTGHLRLELTKVRKYNEAKPIDNAVLQVQNCIQDEDPE